MEFFGLINVVQFFLEYFSFGSSFSSLEERVNYVINTQTISLYVAAGLYVVCLVFGGIGMTVMAKKVGMKHSWLAFLPFANTWYAGKLAGETQLFGQKMKRVGLYAALAEFFFVALSVFGLVLLYARMNPAYFSEMTYSDGSVYYVFDSSLVPLASRWIVTADIVCNVLEMIADLFLIFFLCVLFYAFFRKYYARGPFLMTFMCAVLPLRGFVIFAVRNNTPVDYNAYMRKKMEQYARARQQADPYGGYGQGGYDAYGNQTNSGAGNDDPFSDFGDAPAPSDGGGQDASSDGGQTNGGGKDNNPFPDF